MDWKDILSQKVAAGELEREDSTPAELTESQPSKKETLRVVIDKKGRKGKTATIIEGFSEENEEIEKVEKTLKTRLGVGGSSRGLEILIQGDRANEVKTILRDLGYKVK